MWSYQASLSQSDAPWFLYPCRVKGQSQRRSLWKRATEMCSFLGTTCGRTCLRSGCKCWRLCTVRSKGWLSWGCRAATNSTLILPSLGYFDQLLRWAEILIQVKLRILLSCLCDFDCWYVVYVFEVQLSLAAPVPALSSAKAIILSRISYYSVRLSSTQVSLSELLDHQLANRKWTPESGSSYSASITQPSFNAS